MSKFIQGKQVVRKFLLFAVVFWVSMTEAKELHVRYKVTFGIFGELGVSEARLETKGNRYTISIDAEATGIAKTLSQNRREKHISKGFVRRGIYHAQSYKIEITYGSKKSTKEYVIDHKTKSVTKRKQRFKKGKLVSDSTQKLNFYSTDDLLTLYFNLPGYLKKNAKAGKYRFKAVGAEGQNGKVEIILPRPEERKAYLETLGEGDYRYLTAIIHQKIFNSDKGELMISIAKDGIAQKAVLKDLILFGDLVAKRLK